MHKKTYDKIEIYVIFLHLIIYTSPWKWVRSSILYRVWVWHCGNRINTPNYVAMILLGGGCKFCCRILYRFCDSPFFGLFLCIIHLTMHGSMAQSMSEISVIFGFFQISKNLFCYSWEPEFWIWNILLHYHTIFEMFSFDWYEFAIESNRLNILPETYNLSVHYFLPIALRWLFMWDFGFIYSRTVPDIRSITY